MRSIQSLFLFLFSFCAILLTGCASSDISRSAASKIDNAYQNSSNAVSHVGDDDVTATYPNSSPVAQGAVAGSLIGAVAGGIVTSGPTGILPGAAGGAIFGGVIGGFLSHHETLKDMLENHGAKVFVLGDQVLIVIPSDQVFHSMNNEIYPSAYTTLDLVTRLLNTYATMAVKITVYTQDAGSDRVNQSLSTARAQSVERALRTKVNTRLLVAVGKGCGNLIETEGNPINNRIEITTEKYPV